MAMDLKVLCAEAYDSLPSVVLTTDSRRILLDCGEGVQRLLGEHKVRFSKLDAVCLTRFAPDLFGGLPGLILTSADCGRGSIRLISPPSIIDYWKTTSYFLYRPNFNMLTYELQPTDSNVTSASSGTVRITDSEVCTELSSSAPRARDRVVCTGSLEYDFGDVLLSCVPAYFSIHGYDLPEVRICYICSSPELPGKFDVARATALGVPKGPLFGQLQSGRTVELPDGQTIAPEQVLGAPQPSVSAAVFADVRVPGWSQPCACGSDSATRPCAACTFERNIAALAENPSWEQFRAGQARAGALTCAFHFCSQDAIDTSPAYRALMDGLGPSCTHIVLGREVATTGGSSPESSFMSATAYCSKLRQVCRAMFPKLEDAASDPVTSVGIRSLPGGTVQGHVLMRYNLLPARVRGLDTELRSASLTKISTTLAGYWDTVLRETTAGALLEQVDIRRAEAERRVAAFRNEFVLTSAKYDADLSANERVLVGHGDNELWFLGTASAIPSKYRNVSGIALHVAPSDTGIQGGIVLLDVGEGAWHQLLRIEMGRQSEADVGVVDGEEAVARLLLRRIRVVWVSHPHADHHLGLLSILALKAQAMVRARASVRPHELDLAPIVVIAPPAILSFLEEYCACCVGSSVCVTGAYVPVSTRQIDPTDDCTATDSYWVHEIERCRDCVVVPDTESVDGFSSAEKNSCEGRTVDVNKEFIRYYYRRARAGHGLGAQSVGAGTAAGSAVWAGSVGTPVWLKDHQERASDTYCSPFPGYIHTANQTLAALGVTSITNVRVDHCPQSYGIALELSVPGAETFKLVYSGDTRPCADLVALGRGATLLVHEATFEDDMQADAVAKSHCTISEAIQAGVGMGAHLTVLTHFSQRYTTLPRLPDCAYVREGRVLPAFDFMTVRFADLLWSTHLTPVYYEVLSLERDEDEDEPHVEVGKSSSKSGNKTKSKGSAQNSGTRMCNCIVHRAAASPQLSAIVSTAVRMTVPEFCGVCGVSSSINAGGGKKRKVDNPK